MTITHRELLEQNASWLRDDVALHVVETGEDITYSELDRRVNKLANALRDRGLRSGDKLGMVLYNTVEFPVTLYAAYKIGVVPVPMNYMLAANDFEYILDDTRPEAIVYDEGVSEAVETAVQNISTEIQQIQAGDEPEIGETFSDVVSDGSNMAPPKLADEPGALSHMLYTSGTTGRPKGVCFTRETALARLKQGFANMHMDRQSVALQLSPWFHAGGLGTTLHPTISIGGKLVVTDDWEPDTVINLVEKHRITHTVSVPTILKRISQLDDVTEWDFSSIEFWMSQGAPLSEALTGEIMEKITENLYLGYGTTETLYDTQRQPGDLPEHIDNVGKPVPDKRIRIVEHDESRRVPPDETIERGEEGHIIVKGKANLDYYYGKPEATKDSVHEGWFYSGDLGKLSEDGYLQVGGRADDMILSGGELVAAIEVEEVLEEHEGVESAVVVGVSDEEWGERVKAYIVGTVDEDELERYCKQSDALADFKRPRLYEFIDEIERTATGKKQRFQYRE